MGETTTAAPSHQDTLDEEFPKILIGKRILLATESYGPINGVSKTTQNLVSYLRSHGVNIAVVAPEISTLASSTKDLPISNSPVSITNPSNNIKSNPAPSPNKEIEIRLKGYPLPYDPTLSIVYPVRLSTLYKRTFGESPDLIYLASPASLGFQILLQHRLSPSSSPSNSSVSPQLPILLNFQTDLSGYCSILFPTPLSLWAVLVFRSVQGYLFSHPSVHTIFYPSGFVRRYLEHADVPSQKLVNLRRGVDASLFHPRKKDDEYRKQLAPNNEIILISVSRIAPEKGFDFLAKVAWELERRGVGFKLVVVGGNRNPQVVAEIKYLFGGLVEKGKVVFMGMLRGEGLARVYACGDVFVHCSVTETFGLVVLESMSSGVPVIARDEGGPSEIIADGSSGYLIPPTDLHAFVERVIELKTHTTLRSKMSVTSRKMAEEATWESIGNKVAWEMAGALEERGGETVLERESSSSFGMWVREMCGMGIVVGVWGGLVVTWGLVRVSLGVKGLVGWVRRVVCFKK